MPELPEVEVVRRGVLPFTGAWRVDEVVVLDPRSLKRHAGPPEDFVHRLTGQTLVEVARRGKFLWWILGDGDDAEGALVGHLGMSGQILLGSRLGDFGRLLRVALHLVHPDGRDIWLGFVDQRVFGSLALDDLRPTPDGQAGGQGTSRPLVPSQVAHISRDPLDPAFDERAFISRLRAKNTGVKRALLDQQLISGIGNIYADEALWRVRLHYDYPTSRLSPAKAAELLAAVRAVLAQALEEGGTSFDWQYVNVNGQSGYFSQSLDAYGQDGKPCARCGKIMVREPFMNRSSHRCPHCQRVPRRTIG